jgi:hypothetical protein
MPRPPGLSVWLVCRCGKIRGRVTVVPAGCREPGPPPVSFTLLRGLTAVGPSESFHPA